MAIDEQLAVTLGEAHDLTGLFAAVPSQRLLPIAELIPVSANGEAIEPHKAARRPDLLAQAVNDYAAKNLPRGVARGAPASVRLQIWAIEQFGAAVPAGHDAGALDHALLVALGAGGERNAARMDANKLLAHIPNERLCYSPLLWLAVMIARLRQGEQRRLRGWRRWLGLRPGGKLQAAPKRPAAPVKPPPPAKPEPPVTGPPPKEEEARAPSVVQRLIRLADWPSLAARAFTSSGPGRASIEIWEQKLIEGRMKLGRFNIVVAGRTGVGKTTLIGAIFGREVGDTLAGRPRTRGRKWYPETPGEGDILSLCDTEGLEMERYRETLDGLRQEIAERSASRDPRMQIHIAWLCIDEPSLTVQPGEEEAVRLFHSQGIPVICVLTKAGMAPQFKGAVEKLLPEVKAVVRVRAEPIMIEGQIFPPMGLDALMSATAAAVPEAAERAFALASHNLVVMRARAMQIVRGAAAAAGASGATPLPLADAAGVFSVQAGMIISISLQMGVRLKREDLRMMAVTLVGALGLTAGGRFLAGQVIKLIPGIGSITGAAITGVAAAALTYGLGHAYVEYLARFYERNERMPAAEEIVSGFQDFWRRWRNKRETPPELGGLRPGSEQAIESEAGSEGRTED